MSDKKSDREMEPDTERRIMQAAAKVFMQKGRLGASMQDIADEAGINRTLLNYYFRKKEKLFDAIFDKLASRLFPALVPVLSSDRPFLEKVGVFAESYIRLLNENPFLPIFIFQEISLNPERFSRFIESAGIHPEKTLAALKKEMQKLGMPDMDPRHLFANMLGMLIFPHVARPLFQMIAFRNDPVAYDKFLEERKSQIPEFMRMALSKPQNTKR